MSSKIKILIAEHDPADLELLHYELKKGGINYVSETVQNEKDYADALRHFIPDIILSDYTFPSFDGLTAFKIRQLKAPDTPFIFVSGTIGEEKSIELIRNGVTDYALKNNLLTLIIKIKRALKESKEKQLKTKAVHELIQSEKRLARAQQLAHMGSWELDVPGNIVLWSDETCRIYGLPLNQNRQSFKNWISFIHPEDVDGVLKKVKESGNSLSCFSVNYRIMAGNGSIRHIYSECKPEFDASGKCARLYGIVHDVTEMVSLESKLMQERRTKQNEITAAVLAAQDKERVDLGKELHENLLQILSAVKMYIELAKTEKVNRQKFLDKSSTLLVKVIEEIRSISKTLASPGKQVGLFSSIKVLLDDLTRTHPVEIQFHEDGIIEKSMGESLQLAIFRMVQEQVNNILKHSKATKATISLSRQDDEVILLISDNGKGSDLLKEINGLGINNIKSRAALYNGTVTIVSKPGKGYKLKVELSLNGNINGR